MESVGHHWIRASSTPCETPFVYSQHNALIAKGLKHKMVASIGRGGRRGGDREEKESVLIPEQLEPACRNLALVSV